MTLETALTTAEEWYGEQRMRDALRALAESGVRALAPRKDRHRQRRAPYLAPFGFNDRGADSEWLARRSGGGVASPLDMAQAYSTFANGGYAS